MAKPEQIIASLKKLYAKRGALDKQIIETEKKLIASAKTGKPVAAQKGGQERKRDRKPKKAASAL